MFLLQVWGCNYPASTEGSFYQKGPTPRFTKTCFLAVSEFCKDIPRIQCTILLEKMSGESVLCVLNALPVVTQIRWSCTDRWLPIKKWQVVCCSEKTKNLTKAVVVVKRKINYWVYLAGLRMKLCNFHREEILFLPSGPNSQVLKSMFPSSFRNV